MAVDDSIFFAPIGEIAAKLRAREFSSEELTKAFLDRAERLGSRYNAIALIRRNAAIQAAKDADWYLKRGRDRNPLLGIPFGAKDLLATKGEPTTWGAKPYAGQVFDDDAAVLQRLSKAGAVLVAKLAMVELAGGGGYRFPAASLTGPGLNPWDRTRWSGGSSSGSGAAVAAGLVPFALGSETSGSILTPAAYCGVTGLRPTYGYVSRAGAMALSWTMDKIGPLCRSAEDCGTVLQAIAGKDNEDPGSAGKSFYFAPQFVRAWPDLTIGYSPADFDSYSDPAIRPALNEALQVFRSFGTKVVETEIPDFPYGPVTSTIISSEGAAIFEELITSGRVDDLADQKQIAGLKAGLEIPAKDYLKAMRIRRLIQRSFADWFREIDVILAPARTTVASKISDPLDSGGFTPGSKPTSRGTQGLIPAGNLAGLPALSLPCGFAEGLPVGIQLVARPFNENTLLKLGMEYQSRTDWHRRKPPGV